jgi:hypothetical protein
MTSVGGWDTWTFHSGSSTGATATLQMVGTFNHGSFGGMDSSGGSASLIQGFYSAPPNGSFPSTNGTNGNTRSFDFPTATQFGSTNGPSGSVPFTLDYNFSVNNDQSLMLTYYLTTGSSGNLASFDPSISLILPSGWSATSAAGSDIAATPEAPTWLLFGTGMALIGFMGRRNRKGLLIKA